MYHKLFWMLIVMVLSWGLPTIAQAQTTGEICVVAYEDTNENSSRDPSEVPLSGILVTIARDDIIVQNHLTTDETRPYCFVGLPGGQYTVTFEDSLNHRPTMQNSVSVALEPPQRLSLEFAAVQVSAFETDEASPTTDEELSRGQRLILATLSALVVMVLMSGFGIMIGSFLWR